MLESKQELYIKSFMSLIGGGGMALMMVLIPSIKETYPVAYSLLGVGAAIGLAMHLFYLSYAAKTKEEKYSYPEIVILPRGKWRVIKSDNGDNLSERLN